MKLRVLSTTVLWLGIIAIVAVLGVSGGVLLFTLLALATQYEIYRLLQKSGRQPCLRSGIGAGALLLLVPHFFPGLVFLDGQTILIAAAAAFLLIALRTGRPGLIDEVFVPSLLGLFLGPYLLHFLILPATQLGTAGLMFSIWIVATAKFSDVGALLIGLKWGRRPFSPLSPRKTWEGIIGGLLAGVLVGVAFQLCFARHLPPGFSATNALILAFPVVIFAIAGDLLESAFKRSAGVKDSGRVVPGIGGAYDISDSLTWSAPAGYVIAFGWLLY